jgi:hypothetical protein
MDKCAFIKAWSDGLSRDFAVRFFGSSRLLNLNPTVAATVENDVFTL